MVIYVINIKKSLFALKIESLAKFNYNYDKMRKSPVAIQAGFLRIKILETK
jgi:hypothetical protein